MMLPQEAYWHLYYDQSYEQYIPELACESSEQNEKKVEQSQFGQLHPRSADQ